MFGKFNSINFDKIFIIINENDIKMDLMNTLKHFTTEQESTIERKCKDSFQTKIYTNYWVLGNGHQIFIEKDNRRVFRFPCRDTDKITGAEVAL